MAPREEGLVSAGGVRLSRWVFFIDHDEHTCVEHMASGASWQTDGATAHRLRHWTGFRTLPEELSTWADRRVLVPPDSEPLLPGSASGEAALETAWHDWYWAREPDAEREYRWLGEVVIKMPSDLVFYQEIIANRGARRILEVGSGRGGGLWFFSSVLSLQGGGRVVGVEHDPPERLPDFTRFGAVDVDIHHGDIRDAEVVARLSEAARFDLVVIDAPPAMRDKIEVLRRCAPLVGEGGTIVVEDLAQPVPEAERRAIARELDAFFTDHGDFRPDHEARRHPLLKGGTAAFVRDTSGNTST